MEKTIEKEEAGNKAEAADKNEEYSEREMSTHEDAQEEYSDTVETTEETPEEG